MIRSVSTEFGGPMVPACAGVWADTLRAVRANRANVATNAGIFISSFFISTLKGDSASGELNDIRCLNGRIPLLAAGCSGRPLGQEWHFPVAKNLASSVRCMY